MNKLLLNLKRKRVNYLMNTLIKVYTDGSSSNNGKKNCKSGCGVFFIDSGDKLSLTSGEACNMANIELECHSNNVGELLGILVALLHQKDKNVDILIHTDSMYCLNSLTMWHNNWARNKWITAGGTPVKNKNLIMKILQEKSKFNNTFFKHVRGHKNEPVDKDSEQWIDWYGNDVADFLATKSVHSRD